MQHHSVRWSCFCNQFQWTIIELSMWPHAVGWHGCLFCIYSGVFAQVGVVYTNYYCFYFQVGIINDCNHGFWGDGAISVLKESQHVSALSTQVSGHCYHQTKDLTTYTFFGRVGVFLFIIYFAQVGVFFWLLFCLFCLSVQNLSPSLTISVLKGIKAILISNINLSHLSPNPPLLLVPNMEQKEQKRRRLT